MRLFLILAAITMTQISSKAAELHYSVAFPDANKHYAQISITVDVDHGDIVTFKMPVWTPGSYKVREFSQHVDQTWYSDGDTMYPPERLDKNTWECLAKWKGKLTFTYNLYAFELGVRTSYIDQYMAFLHGPSAFMYVKGKEDKSIQLEFSPLSTWKHVEAALPNTSGSSVSFEVVNYDLLADSPIALGNFDISTYETAGVPHRIVMMGKGNYDLDKVTEDFKKISDEEVKMFGGKHPCERYTHFIQNVESGGGGLEHLNCQTSQVNRWAYTNSDKYRNFLGLISHEYFHLWNVKRIRPYELGPFDYEKENYTDMLWVAEGITSYFDDLFLKRAGIHSTESYLAALAGNINRLENQPGKDVMSLDESSKLAWVKAYLSNENSKNVTISYYNKGMLVAWMLDLEILTNTNGKKRLDDVLQILFDTYYTKEGRGFTHKEFIAVCEKVAGKNMDDFFMKYVFQKDAIPYSDYLAEVGIDMEDRANGTASIGVSAKQTNGKLLITYVHPDGSGVEAGLSVNDEIIAINNWRVGSDLSDEIARLPIGSKAELLYNRDGLVHSTMISIKKSPAVQYRLSAEEDLDKSVQKLQDIWLN